MSGAVGGRDADQPKGGVLRRRFRRVSAAAGDFSALRSHHHATVGARPTVFPVIGAARGLDVAHVVANPYPHAVAVYRSECLLSEAKGGLKTAPWIRRGSIHRKAVNGRLVPDSCRGSRTMTTEGMGQEGTSSSLQLPWLGVMV